MNTVDVTKNKKILSKLQDQLDSEKEGHFVEVIGKKNNLWTKECHAIYDGKKLAGFVTLSIFPADENEEGFVEFYRLNVFQYYRKKGLAKDAIYSLIENLKQRGYSSFCIEVTDSNAHGFWRNFITRDRFELTHNDTGSGKYCFKTK